MAQAKNAGNVDNAGTITRENFLSRPCQPRGGWTLDQLKEFARSLGLKVSGTKPVLCQRIEEALGVTAPAVATSQSPPRSPPRPESPPRPYGPEPRPPPRPPTQAQLKVQPRPQRRPSRRPSEPTPELEPKPILSRPVEPLPQSQPRPPTARPQVQPITPVRVHPPSMSRAAPPTRGPAPPVQGKPAAITREAPPTRGPSPPRPRPEFLFTGPVSTLNPCDEFSSNAVPEATIQSRREYIFDTLRQRLGGNPNRVAEMTNEDLRLMLGLYDDLFLQRRLRTYLQQHGDEEFRIEFGRGTRVAGYCQTKRRPRCVRILSMSRPVHTQIFTGSAAHATETNAGLQCTNQLSCLQLTLEHELIHLLIDIWCPDRIRREGHQRGGRRAPREVHGDLFKAMARNLFGHRDFRHSLGRGLAEDPAVHIGRVKAYLKPGMLAAVYDRRSKSTVNYQVLEVNPRSNVKRFLGLAPDGKRYRIPMVNVILPGENPEDLDEGSEGSEEGDESEGSEEISQE
jgi:hypothetical protein